MNKTINKGEKIMKGRFFTLIIGLCLVAGSAMAGDDPTITFTPTVNGDFSVPIKAPDGAFQMNWVSNGQNSGGSGTNSTVYCGTPIPAVEVGKLFAQAHNINKYTQLRTTQETMKYLTAMGIYNGTTADVAFNGKGGITGWTTTQQTPGYWGTQIAMIDAMSNNPMLAMIMNGSGGSMMGGNMWGGYSSFGSYPNR